MIKSYTITSKDRPDFQDQINLSSLTDYRIETVTINAKAITEKLFNFVLIDSELHEIENAAIADFLKFEDLD